MTNLPQVQGRIFYPTTKTFNNYVSNLKIKRYTEIVNKLKNEQILSFDDQCVLFLVMLARANEKITADFVKHFAYEDEFWQISELITEIAQKMAKDDFLELLNAIADVPKQEIPTKKTYIIFNKQTKRFKIGKSKNPEQRIYKVEMLVGSKLEILCIFNRDIEKQLHELFDDYREIGEWFYDRHGDIQRLVDNFTHKGEAWVIEKLANEGVIA